MHTLGPLTIKGPSPGDNTGCDDGGDYAIIDGKGKIIAEAISKVDFAGGGGYDTRPAKANAQLYAAAPDLLEACRQLRNEIEEYRASSLGMVMARDAIEKVKGD